ncbi:MAG: chalcone isomerase family protein [Flavobacterium sp.]|nr:chalcone isomerase family protein [Flavobacterium sp.]
MKQFSIILLVLSFFTANSQTFVELDGVKLPTILKVKEENLKTKLLLNGYGVRDKMWISLYVQALYLTEKSSDPVSILNSNTPMAIKLHVTSSLITRQKLIDALKDGIKKSLTGKMSDIQDKMDTFISYLNKPIKEDDVYDFVYNSNNENLTVYINDEKIGTVNGFAFKRAFFGIWLEEKCADKTLKKRLLGL